MKNLGEPETLHAVRERLWTVEPGDLPRWGTMSVGQMIRHLGLAYDMSLGNFVAAPVKGPPPWLLKFAALKVNMNWPPNVRTTPELKRAIQQAVPQDSLDADIMETAARMEELASGLRYAPSHPMFGAMKPADWLRWGYLHADHHLRQFGR
ncbi:Protein of unknown function [Granulicella pectinivorans]|jgi:hypothetical protein|uniref:DinB superfamily protein n=1 Tax=Granulicella pectinivorans TaxID=474950 RepID=A0A1I6M7R4_9BACT|nr:DUF1569 domain-containing protein [Granulicella pectinivorans]SFS11648.1 Protein of unknown function [Granulicella pectinivorans]